MKKGEGKKDKCLHFCKSIIDANEYGKMAKYFPNIYLSYVFNKTCYNLILTTIVAIISKSIIETVLTFMIFQIFIMVLYKIRLEYYVEKSYIHTQKNRIIDTDINIEFYDEYLIRKGDISTIRVNYSDINRCIETDTNFYLYYKAKNLIIFIQKDKCDIDTIKFIKEKFSNLEQHLNKKKKVKNSKISNNSFIKYGMIILFIATIASLWGSLMSIGLMCEIKKQHGFAFLNNFWLCWCWLPFPVLSIFLGHKYKENGLNFKANIVAGYVIGCLLLVLGTLCFLPNFQEDYSKIDEYRSIIDAQLPDNGQLEIQKFGSYVDIDKSDYSIINVYYDNENVNNLVKSIKNSSNWVLSKEIKSELKIFIPSTFYPNDNVYYSICNRTVNECNKLPDESGEYQIYAIKYDMSNKHLEIHKFKYKYNK